MLPSWLFSEYSFSCSCSIGSIWFTKKLLSTTTSVSFAVFAPFSSRLTAAVVAEYGVKQFTSNDVGSVFTVVSIIGSCASSCFSCSSVTSSTFSPFSLFATMSLIIFARSSSSARCVIMCSISSGRWMNCDAPALCASRFSSSWIQKQSTGWLRMKSSAYT